ncbi:GDP-mannose 4,6-dehydratase [Candidatus Pelagibacter sp. Uisw_121]|uniref:GDP-mannose 4,6-dehydratase n=1 Tax=Candidatus Pelagibacter sp. Uisw_121 TaxID=3230987 RepID=UPI0039E9DAEC
MFFIKDDIQNKSFSSLLGKIKPDVIIHLAAQAGVRFSYKNPFKYIDYNITGFLNLLESMKKYKLNNLIYASSSSIYGNVSKIIFKLSNANFLKNKKNLILNI